MTHNREAGHPPGDVRDIRAVGRVLAVTRQLVCLGH
jgi:hypothetical protein